MESAYICDAIRTPIGRYGGTLASIRTDDLAAIPIKALIERNAKVDWNALDDVIYGCANQAGEDNRNIGRMAALLAGLPKKFPAATRKSTLRLEHGRRRHCRARHQMRRSRLHHRRRRREHVPRPICDGQSGRAFSRSTKLETPPSAGASSIPSMKAKYGVDSMPETGEMWRKSFTFRAKIRMPLPSEAQQRAAAAMRGGLLARKLFPPRFLKQGEMPFSSAPMSTLAPIPLSSRAREVARHCEARGTVTAGNASGVNDGACALLLASESAAKRHGLTPQARIVASAAAGVAPRIMGIGPAPASENFSRKQTLTIGQMQVIELNEAFASQALAVLRELGVPDDAAHVNPNGGAIALGHPLGASGARLITTAMYQLLRTGGKYALCTMCIGVGQGIAVILERI